MKKTEEKQIKKKNKKIAICISLIAMFLISGIMYIGADKQVAYATKAEASNKNIKISNASKINIQDFINQNAKTENTEQIVNETIEIEYITEYVENNELPTGTLQVIQEGRIGVQQNTIKKTYENQIEIEVEQLSTNIIKSPINKIVEIGTGKRKTTKITVKLGDTVYVTSDRLTVYLENSQESQKIGTLNKSAEATVLQIEKEWYKVETKRVTGWVKSESVTNINLNKKYEEEVKQNSSTNIIQKLDFNMALNSPSGLTIEQFKKVLSDSKDKNNIFEESAEYFYYIEEQYNINGLFVAAVGIHESVWGTSKLAINKKNLFGYGASDSNPYGNAYSFDNYSESIDLLARVFTKYYLNPKGTSIYGGEVANGRYYNGNTLAAVNKKYASDSNWANAVYNHMKYLYNKL